MADFQQQKTPEQNAEDAAKHWESIKDSAQKSTFGILENMAMSAEKMYLAAKELDRAFLTSGVRIDEMSSSFAKAVPVVTRLGGSITDVGVTITQIAESSRRNVIETEEVVGKLYATSKVLGESVGKIATAFGNVGIQTENIGKNVEDSVRYVQSIGLNAKTVMGSVLENMELLNRFNFANGVEGLTKMAAQASMLKFDMRITADFADKVLSPEGAIEAASAFQRLGVAVGDLGDPLTMMNDALVNPGALQDSIIKATQQFTEFDEKTKTFKINPQGILTLKEMAGPLGTTAAELSKAAIASADLNRRLSDVKLDIPEDDRTLLANMAVMKDGKYQVKLGLDNQGQEIWEGLGDVTKDQFGKLKEIQEKAPKTMEDIARGQMDITQRIAADVKSIAEKAGYSVADLSVIRKNISGLDRLSNVVTGTVSGVVQKAPITEELSKAMVGIADLVKGKDKMSDKDFQLKIKETEKSLESKFKGVQGDALNVLKDAIKDINKKIEPGRSDIEKYAKSEIFEPLAKYLDGQKQTTKQKPTTQVTNPNTTKPQTKITPQAEANQNVRMPVVASPNQTGQIASANYDNLRGIKGTGNESLTTAVDGQIDFGTLTMNININSTLGVDKKLLEDSLGSVEFRKEFKDGVIDFVRKSLVDDGAIKKTGMA